MSDPHAPKPDDRPEPDDRADAEGLEPYDGDVTAERDRARHVDKKVDENW